LEGNPFIVTFPGNVSMIQKIHVLAIIVPAVMLPVIALMILTPVAYANNAAVVIDGQSCSAFDGNGGIADPTTISHMVVTHSGNALFTCKMDVTPSSTGHAVKYDVTNNPFSSISSDPVTCTIGALSIDTTDWQEIISADGQATLVCHVK